VSSCRKDGRLNRFCSFPSCCWLVSNRPEVVTGPKGNPGLISRQSTTRSPITYISSLRPVSLVNAVAAQRIPMLNISMAEEEYETLKRS
jgi:hypothetical protein